MSLIRRGAHRASPQRSDTPTVTNGEGSINQALGTTGATRRGAVHMTVALLLIIAVLVPSSIGPSGTDAATNYLLMPRSELLKLPTTGTAWSNMKAIAESSFGTPDLCNQDSQHGVKALAAALVYARTGWSNYGAKARSAVMAAIGTLNPGCHNAILSLGRQLGAYVLAADFADLSGSSETTFRAFLSRVRTQSLGGHSVWSTLKGTHMDAQNNWGSFAGASRIAASLYIGDTADVAAASKVLRGFLGNRSAYAFPRRLTAAQVTWTCSGSSTNYTPVNGGCTRSGINLDGAIVTDIARGGSLRWPPADPGISYVLESLQGLVLQTELLYRNGYGDAWTWSNSALKRIASTVSRSGAAGGTTWNHSSVKRHLTWILNRRYGLNLPRQLAGMGRVFGYTDWLYGSSASSGSGGSGGSGGSTGSSAPVVSAPNALLSKTSPVPISGVPAVVDWSLKSAATSIRREELQYQRNGGAWTAIRLSSTGATSARFTLASGTYRFRARAIDTAGRVGAWVYGSSVVARGFSEANPIAHYSGSWATTSYSGYLGGHVRYTNSAGASVTLSFTGRSFQWIGPVGSTRGKAQVFIDGAYKATIDEYASSFNPRRVLYAVNLRSGWHRVVIKALGTSGRPTVAFDAGQFLVVP